MKLGIKILRKSDFIYDSLYCNFFKKKYLIISCGLIIKFYEINKRMKHFSTLKVAVPVCKIFSIEYFNTNYLLLLTTDGQWALYGRSECHFNVHHSFKGELFTNDSIKLTSRTKKYVLLYMESKSLILFSLSNFNKSINRKIFEFVREEEEILSILVVGDMMYYLLLNGKNDLYVFSYLIREFNLDINLVSRTHIQSLNSSPCIYNIYLFGSTRPQLYLNNKIINVDKIRTTDLSPVDYTRYFISAAVEVENINYLITRDGEFLKTVNNTDFYLIGKLQKPYDTIISIGRNYFFLIYGNMDYALVRINEPMQLFNLTQLCIENNYTQKNNLKILHNYSPTYPNDRQICYFNIFHSIRLTDAHIYNMKIKNDYLVLNTNMGAYIYRFNGNIDYIAKIRYEIYDMEKWDDKFRFLSANGIYAYSEETCSIRLIKNIKNIQYGIFLKKGFLLLDNKSYLREYIYNYENQIRYAKFNESFHSMEYDGRFIFIYTYDSKKYIFSRNLEFVREENYLFKKHVYFDNFHISWKKQDLIVNKNERLGTNLSNIIGGGTTTQYLVLYSMNEFYLIDSVYKMFLSEEKEKTVENSQFKIEDDFLLVYKGAVIVNRLHLNFPVAVVRKIKYGKDIYLFLGGEYSHFLFLRYKKGKFHQIHQSYIFNEKFIECKILNNILCILSENKTLYFYRLENDRLIFTSIFNTVPVDRIMTFTKKILYFNYLRTGLGKLYFIRGDVEIFNKKYFRNYLFKLIDRENIIYYNLLKEYVNKINKKILKEKNILKLPFFKLKNKKYDYSPDR